MRGVRASPLDRTAGRGCQSNQIGQSRTPRADKEENPCVSLLMPSHPSPRSLAPQSIAKTIVLTSSDGTKFAAFAARAEQPNGAGMVVMPDVRGLFSFYEELALRFAEQGINAVTIDYFGRTAGVGESAMRSLSTCPKY